MQKPTRNRILLAVAAAAVAALVVWALWPSAVPVEVVRVERGVFVDVIEEDGRTRTRERYVVSAPLPGVVARIELHAGDPVEEGQLLASLAAVQPSLLDARTRAELAARVDAAEAAVLQARARLEQARAALDIARSDHRRAERLYEGGAMAEQDVDQAAAEVHSGEHEVEAARFAVRTAAHEVELARAAAREMVEPSDGACCEIRSPAAGRVLKVRKESEGVVEAGTPLLEIGDVGSLEVVVDLLTEDAVRVRPGAPVRLVRWGGGGPLMGRVRRVEPSAETRVSALGVEEQRVDVIVELTSPPPEWARLGDGFRVEAEILTARLDDVVTLPVGALFREGDDWAVYVVREGQAELRRVRLGPRSSTRAVVARGVAPGELVVVHPGDEVTDGARVDPSEAPAGTAEPPWPVEAPAPSRSSEPPPVAGLEPGILRLAR